MKAFNVSAQTLEKVLCCGTVGAWSIDEAELQWHNAVRRHGYTPTSVQVDELSETYEDFLKRMNKGLD